MKVVFFFFFFKNPEQQVAIKQITKKQLAKSQSLLEKEIKILKVRERKSILWNFIGIFF